MANHIFKSGQTRNQLDTRTQGRRPQHGPSSAVYDQPRRTAVLRDAPAGAREQVAASKARELDTLVGVLEGRGELAQSGRGEDHRFASL